MPTNFPKMLWFRRASKSLLACVGLLVFPFILSQWLGLSVGVSQLLGALALGAFGTIAVFFGMLIIWITLEAVLSILIGVRCALRQSPKL